MGPTTTVQELQASTNLILNLCPRLKVMTALLLQFMYAVCVLVLSAEFQMYGSYQRSLGRSDN